MSELLSVKKLCKSFDNVQVLKEVSFSVEKGEVLAVIGKSGGGKTTTLRCINMLTKPDSGYISVGGSRMFDSLTREPLTNAEYLKARLKIGLVFQSYNLFPQYNVLHNLTLAPLCHKGKAEEQEAEKKAMQILERMGLADKAKAHPSELSGGQQQRVAIARALMLEPDLLCFDEPTSALDPELTGEVVRIIKDLKASGTTMVIVTHDMEFAKQAADRVIFFADGRIEEEGIPSEIFENPKSEKLRSFVQLGDDPN